MQVNTMVWSDKCESGNRSVFKGLIETRTQLHRFPITKRRITHTRAHPFAKVQSGSSDWSPTAGCHNDHYLGALRFQHLPWTRQMESFEHSSWRTHVRDEENHRGMNFARNLRLSPAKHIELFVGPIIIVWDWIKFKPQLRLAGIRRIPNQMQEMLRASNDIKLVLCESAVVVIISMGDYPHSTKTRARDMEKKVDCLNWNSINKLNFPKNYRKLNLFSAWFNFMFQKL